MCKVLQVSRSGYYDWRNRGPSKRKRRNKELLELIRQVHKESRGTYGSPRVTAELKARDVEVGRRRVARLMRENYIRGRSPRRFRATTDSDHRYEVAPNLVEREFEADEPGKIWLADITYVHTNEGWLYLAAVLDLFDRKIIGWSMGITLERKLVCDALKSAVANRTPKVGLIHHSDRGSQYASDEFQALLREHNILCSMSRTGDCWDNAPMESFFGSLKNELIHRCSFPSRASARQKIFEYVEVFYNRKRRHSALGYQTPVEYYRSNVS
jgi:transposase InsO family protein